VTRATSPLAPARGFRSSQTRYTACRHDALGYPERGYVSAHWVAAVTTGAKAVMYERSLSGARGVVTPRAMGRHGAPGSSTVLRILLVAVPVVLAGYALDDRGFAYLASVPGTPLFAGEMILLFGLAFMTLATGYLRAALRRSIPMALLLIPETPISAAIGRSVRI
jgi:hypothetical protein